jgi:TolB protein
VVQDDGSRLRQLAPGGADSYEPAWSPDAKRIAFVRSRLPGTEIWTMDADGSDLRLLTGR